MDDFKQLNFFPAYYAEFNQATIFKFENQWREEDARTYITLGVIKQ